MSDNKIRPNTDPIKPDLERKGLRPPDNSQIIVPSEPRIAVATNESAGIASGLRAYSAPPAKGRGKDRRLDRSWRSKRRRLLLESSGPDLGDYSSISSNWPSNMTTGWTPDTQYSNYSVGGGNSDWEPICLAINASTNQNIDGFSWSNDGTRWIASTSKYGLAAGSTSYQWAVVSGTLSIAWDPTSVITITGVYTGGTVAGDAILKPKFYGAQEENWKAYFDNDNTTRFYIGATPGAVSDSDTLKKSMSEAEWGTVTANESSVSMPHGGNYLFGATNNATATYALTLIALGTPYDPTTLGTKQHVAIPSLQHIHDYLQDVVISPDGTQIIAHNGTYLMHYTLSTPWTLSTISGYSAGFRNVGVGRAANLYIPPSADRMSHCRFDLSAYPTSYAHHCYQTDNTAL